MNFASQLLAATSQAADQWSDLFFGLDQNQRFVLMIIAIGCVTAILVALPISLAGIYAKTRHRQAEAEMKREMLDRGMSSEEIAQIIESAPPSDFLDRWAASCGKKKTG